VSVGDASRAGQWTGKDRELRCEGLVEMVDAEGIFEVKGERAGERAGNLIKAVKSL